ncbi:MAG: TIGR04283 family arsenosugar biosynthesis glycosyltransferase [Cyanobacteriota bacterium]|nr:TIGR04283 family arsenosugar biosynthesis glycosyltransferase [Cyanobacteriota bacterium]
MPKPLTDDSDRLPCQGAIVFTRYPQPGQTKTRLIPALGAAGAAELQWQMTEQTLASFLPLLERKTLQVDVCYTGGTRRQMQRWLGENFTYRSQGTGDLGARLTRAFDSAFDRGLERAIAVGIDCPTIDPSTVDKAFEALENCDLVLGPAVDGGYYLIGLRRAVPKLFAGIDWGGDRVLAQTVAAAESLGLSIAYLAPQADIDRPEDLAVWEGVLDERDRTQKISAVVPVLNEAPRLKQTLARLEGACNLETIVVDGGSSDNSVAIARAAGAQVLSTAPGRAGQMNAGAKVATGDILLFLHGDTQLPSEFDRAIRQYLVNPQTIAGAFELNIEGNLRGLDTIASGTNWRSRRLQMPYGDQGLFLRTATFEQMGGFREMPLMEDFEFVRQLKRHGRIAIVPAAVLVSGRRWQKLGVWRTTLTNGAIVIAYLLGCPPQWLARWYWGSDGRSNSRSPQAQPTGNDEP